MTVSQDFSKQYLEYLTNLIEKLDTQSIAQFADLLLDSRDSGSTTFFLGNGGSASTATHFVNDVSLGSRQFDKPFRAISLCDNQAVITAIANDDGYENIFLQQLQTLAKPGDTIVCISASGNSKNLINAIEYAKQHSIYVVGLTAFDGGYLKENCDLNIHVPTKVGEYGPAEDLHMVVCGLIGSYFREKFLNV
ncbi:SIS domain-containing protein [Gammaproteobacteria bacterium]|jgi:D-sedoheptulose 7-phosphate isomerase|nr:SIS domain-containing protein [Gammaproteobacteria bacterium]|tara:strand:- start:205 stop:783 length:579 start_codon:yes stop_codon:yes gene_type:complete